MKEIAILGIIAECAVLILLTVLKKWTKKAFIAVAAATALCCGLVGILMLKGRISADALDQRAYLYMAGRLIEEDYEEASLEALSAVSDKKSEPYNGPAVRALAYNLNGAYDTAESYLRANADAANAQSILESSEKGEPVPAEVKTAVTEEALALIAATEEESRQWEAEMKVRFMGLALESGEQEALSSELARVQSAISEHRYEEAYQLLTENTGSQSMKNAVIVSNMYVKNYNQRIMADTDAEYDRLWQEAAKLQSQLNLASLDLQEGDTESEAYRSYQTLNAQYSLSLEALNQEAAKRAINYLTAVEESAGDDILGYQLQLARLYFTSNQFEEAREYLEKVFVQVHENDELWLSRETAAFREAYITYLSNPLNTEYSLLFDSLMESLYQSVFDSDNYNAFREFVFSYLRRCSGALSSAGSMCPQFPQILAEISTTREGMELTEDSVRLTDTGTEIEEFSAEPVTVNDLSIAFVLDRSGSMQGDKMAESKNAIRECVSQMLNNVSLSFITFESSSRLECGLTQSKYLITSLVDGISTTGGTNIASGLSTAIESLQAAAGTRIIILLSDGHDGDDSEALIDSVLAEAVAGNITIFCIGLQGCDEAYLQNISTRTNGQFIMVTNAAELDQTYEEIQNAVVNNYQVSYQVSGDEESRSLTVESKDSYAQARREYRKTEAPQERYDYAGEMQEAGYYKQTGGTGR